MERSIHIPVLFDEVIEWLEPSAGKTFVDGTLGGGGHTAAIAERVGGEGLVLAVDLDPLAIDRAETILAGKPIKLVQANYAEIPEVLAQVEIPVVDGILLDLGLSSDQLADGERGFSFQTGGPLDLRFNPDEGESASELLAHIGEDHLADIIYRYGEERCSRRIAKKVVATRRKAPIQTAEQLAELVRSCVPRSHVSKIDPATRTFQALRIAVNGELDSLESALKSLPDCLKPGGRLAIISFHSLEDRLVKHAFRSDERLKVLTRKPIAPTEAEAASNPRARSAKMRVAERVLS
ncbi:16S rRNA (cytosine(1402)-N(4))-methyltransferase RsmH [Bythopirellula goksoeyrii]|uniref:Ribosomal RNA small subunit methyltransferase H n=1 Tax=Bythopirellula goksoeyrii TaxID=1400387 RepID=A0A5B9QAT8_9BACT|nr:16S rRNA (cytosine(1402)-N(4))-methyltransferase RsmH [Bythopirellula goksoeyrii]QEG34602.1 Ribosomal RNA small subunit methyltransferase H [Bythopirellula goksoeyrii]